MARPTNKLTASALRFLPPGKYGDGAGLWFVKVEPGEHGKWIYRFEIGKRRREMGLGSSAGISLRQARQEAQRCRSLVLAGKDPIAERERERREAMRDRHLLRDVARDAFEARKADLRGDGEAGRWMTPLELHVLPKIGHLPVAEVDQIAIRDVLSPLWHDKHETARKAATRLGIVLTYAAALGLPVDLQAVAKARALLGKTRAKAENIPAMPYPEVPAFYASLTEPSAVTLSLRMVILTGLRSKPVRMMRHEWIGSEAITVPAEMMKGREGHVEDFRVPLTDEIRAVVDQARPLSRDGWVFPSPVKGVTSDASMSALMERRGLPYRPHGFRSSLRTWLAEKTDAPEHIAEAMLAHMSAPKVVRAYRRSDFLEIRAELLTRWCAYVSSETARGVL